MKSETKEKRRNEIMDAASMVLKEEGYRNASMLKIARSANASKETLYSWFGDKRGLFEALIQRNATEVCSVLKSNLQEDVSLDIGLIKFGEALLRLLMSESSISLNRAAISELQSAPELAETLIRSGRNATIPLFINFLEYQRKKGTLHYDNPETVAGDFLGLLISDLNVSRLLGVSDAPNAEQIKKRALHATRSLLHLYQKHS